MTATGFHERHQELALAVDVAEEQKIANAELIKVRGIPVSMTYSMVLI